MANNRVQIIIDATNLAGDELKELDKDLKGLGDSAQENNGIFSKMQASWGQLAAAGGVVAAAAIAAKKAFDFAAEGAELDLLATKFENVAENAGYTADILLSEMTKATGGLVSQATLMQSGLDIVRLGLADSQQGVVDLAKAVSVLGLDMQQVIMTFANDSVMRLDALGLSAERVTNRAKELKDEGFVGDAFDQAVLEGLNEQMEILGDQSQTTAGKVQILKTSFDDLKNEIAQNSSETDFFNQLLDQANFVMEGGIAGQVGALYEQRLANITAEYADLDNNLSRYIQTQEESNDVIGEGGDILDFYQERAEETARSNQFLGDEARRAAQGQDQLTGSLNQTAMSLDQVNTGISGTIDRMQEQIAFLQAGGGAIQQAVADIQAAFDSRAITGDQAQEALKNAEIAAIDLGLELNQIDATEAAAKLEELGFGPEEAIAKVQELQASIFALQGKTIIIDVVQRASRTGGGGVGGTGGGGTTGADFGTTVPRQLGGPVRAGQPTLVHEDEVIVPRTAGNVIPANRAMGGNVTIVNNNFNPLAGAIVAAMQQDAISGRLDSSMARA